MKNLCNSFFFKKLLNYVSLVVLLLSNTAKASIQERLFEPVNIVKRGNKVYKRDTGELAFTLYSQKQIESFHKSLAEARQAGALLRLSLVKKNCICFRGYCSFQIIDFSVAKRLRTLRAVSSLPNNLMTGPVKIWEELNPYDESIWESNLLKKVKNMGQTIQDHFQIILTTGRRNNKLIQFNINAFNRYSLEHQQVYFSQKGRRKRKKIKNELLKNILKLSDKKALENFRAINAFIKNNRKPFA